MVLSLSQEEWDSDAFLKMKKLRYLKISDVLLPQGLNYLSTELVVIECTEFNVGIVKLSILPECLIEISRSQFVAWLRRYHEVEITSQPLMAHGLSSWSCQIPGWFINQNNSSFVTIPLPKEIVSWTGCALSVGLVVHQDFDLSHDLKVKHVFDCYSDGGVWNKQTLFHEINVRDMPFPGQIMYWISIPYIWFSQQCNAFNECTSITASTIIDSPYVKVEMSGNRLLYNQQDFIEFTRAIESMGCMERIRKNEKNNSGQLIKMARTEQQRQVAPLTEQLESLPSDLECYQCRNFCGGKWYMIEGKLNHPWTATLLGEILQEYSLQNYLFIDLPFHNLKFQSGSTA
ncbi:hypothetical protein M0R45_019269 [Rubus argutus]|uniref:Uncharacterized protein n=1 Tax=Rubus argutus TaxID=59490 RepID=A0AAW1X4Y9_RUBAR